MKNSLATRKNRTLCPAVSARDYSNIWSTATIPCVPDDRCVCADSSFVRELVNVTLEGLSCYACEPRRPPACTEDTDQCTPEACECADTSTHVKQAASTTTGTLCHFCEPIGGFGSRFGLPEVAIIAMLVSLVFICQWGGKKQPSSGLGKGNLRLARRQGDRSRAIKVHQESVSFLEECFFIIGDVFDALIAGVCELAGGIWNLFCFVCGAAASLSMRVGGGAGAATSKAYATSVQYGQRFRTGASLAAKAITDRTVSKHKLASASAQNGNKAAQRDSGDAVHTTAPGVRKRGGRKDSKVCNLVDNSTGPPASPPQEHVEAPRIQERVVCTSGNISQDDAQSKANARGNSTPPRHHAAASANVCKNSAQARHKSTAVACEKESSTPMRHPSAAEGENSAPMKRQLASEGENSAPMKRQLASEATDRVDDSSAAYEDNSKSLTTRLSGDVIEPALRRLSTDCPQIGDLPRVEGAVKDATAACNLMPLRTFLGEPVPKVALRRTASDSDLTLYN